MPKIKLIITTYTSERDVYGNCYHAGVAVSTETGERATFGYVGGESNLTHDALSSGLTWDDIHYSQIVMGKRAWRHQTKGFEYRTVEDTRRTLRTLAGLGPCEAHKPNHRDECRNCGVSHGAMPKV